MCMHMTCTCIPSLFAPDQEPDDFTVAQSTPLPEDIIGVAGDTVREPPHTQPLQRLLFRCNLSPVHV